MKEELLRRNYIQAGETIYGFAFVGGSYGSVGVSGITLGGGVGYLQREYGLICDNLA